VDPVNRKHNALLHLRVLEQRPTQTVRDVVAKIEELEKDIPAMTIEETKAWTLLTALHPDTRNEVLKENRNITSRAQVIASAQRQEELRKSKDKGKEKASTADNTSDKPAARKKHAFRGRDRGYSGGSLDRSRTRPTLRRARTSKTSCATTTARPATTRETAELPKGVQPRPHRRRQKTRSRRHDRISGVGS
jgi:hypothetical protein